MLRVRRKARWLATVMAVLAGAAALGGGGPARADQVRQKEVQVLNALDVPAAWQVTQGRGVLVAVIDSGVDPSVSDLTGSVVSGPDFTGVGTPESSPGWGAHGTWMASLIAGHGHGRGNSNGVIGVAPQARILSIRVITDRFDTGYAAYQAQPPGRGQQELARGIKYAVSHGADVISMSLGYVAPSMVVRSALQDAVNHNVVVVASSGNSGTAQTAVGRGHAPYSFPADYPGVVGVAAINSSGQPAGFSSDNLSVQVAAPGVNVPAQGRGSHYWLVSGTSPACALTAGVAALIRAKYPKLSAAQVRRAITSSTVNRPSGGYDDQVGFGTLDAARALAAARRLARRVPVAGSPAVKGGQTGYFGTGRLPAVPVPPRGKARLLELAAVAAFCLLLVFVSTWRFATGVAAARKARRTRRVLAPGGPVVAGGPAMGGPPAIGGPVLAGGTPAQGPLTAGYGVTVADVRYPPGAFHGQPGQGGPPLPGGPGLPGMPGQAGPGYVPQPDPGSAGWTTPSPGLGFRSPDSAFASGVTPGQQEQQPWPVPGFGPSGGMFAPSDVTDQQPWPGPGFAPQAPAEPWQGATAPGPGFRSHDAALVPPELPERRGWPPADESLSPPTTPGHVQPSPGQPEPSGPLRPGDRSPDGQRGAPPAKTSQWKDDRSNRKPGIVDPVLGWLDRTYPAPGSQPRPAAPVTQPPPVAPAAPVVPAAQTPDRPLTEPQALPKRRRPAPSQPSAQSVFQTPAPPVAPGGPRAITPIDPADPTQPRVEAPGTAAESRAEQRPEADPPRGGATPQQPESVWDPWSPSTTIERASPPQGSDAHDAPT